MYDVAIPTRGRVGKLWTVGMLRHLKTVNIIYIFTANSDEYINLKKKHNKDSKINIIKARVPQGVVPIKNYIREYFPDGKKFIMMDDDVRALLKLNASGSRLYNMDYDEIDTFINDGFRLLKRHKTKMFGLYPIKNSFFMSNKISPFGFICGLMIGFINDKSIMIDTNLRTKMDYDLTIKHILKFKKVIRFDNITFSTKAEKGTGCLAYRNDEVRIKDAEYLADKYPKYVILNTKRVGEILLKFKGIKND